MKTYKCFVLLLKMVLFLMCTLYYQEGQCKIKLSDIYIVLPDLEKSFPGVIKPSEKVNMLNRLNFIRKLHGLSPVNYDMSYENSLNQSAMLMAANSTISHHPGKDLRFYSEDSAKGCRISNLYLRCHTLYIMDMKTYQTQAVDPDSEEGKTLISEKLPSSSDIVDQWLIDENVTEIGHRRWILNPFLKKVAFSRVDAIPMVKTHCDFITAAALRIKNDISEENNQKHTFEMDSPIENADTGNMQFFGKMHVSQPEKIQQIIAYPYGDYPETLYSVGTAHSFSLLINNTEFFENENVDFKAAFVTVVDESGNQIPVTGIRENYIAYGIPNCLQWKQSEVQKNVIYKVTVNNIFVDEKSLSYSYTFSIKKIQN